MKPKKGVVAICGAGSLGLITSNEKERVIYDDGTGAMAWTGIHLTGKLEHAEPGDDWSSRSPEVIGDAGDLVQDYLELVRSDLEDVEADIREGVVDRSGKESHNTEYTIRVGAPLLRPGMEIEAGEVSEAYVEETAKRLMDAARSVNDGSSERN